MMSPASRAAPPLGVLLLAMVACAPAATTGSRTVVVGTTVDLDGVNELVSGGSRFTNEVLELMFLNLLEERTDWSEHPPTLAPELAASWELSADRRLLTFRLRPDARWSDGAPITAEDVRFTWLAQRSPAIAWRYASSKEAIEEVDVVDPTTVRLRFRAGHPYQVIDANDGHVLPSHAWRELPFERWQAGEDWFRGHLVTSGPFRLDSWAAKRELVLARSPAPAAAESSAGAAGAVERVVLRVVPDMAALLERLVAGEIDFVDGLSPRDAERVRAAPGLRLIRAPGRQFDFVGWNQRRAPFDDPEVRRALTLGIDRRTLVDALWGDAATVAAGPIPPGVWARDSELEPWPYDPAAARALLERRGFRDTDGDGVVERDGRPFRFELATNAGNRVRADAATLMREQLARIGVAVELRTIEFQALQERAQTGDFDAVLMGFSVDTTLDLRPYFHSAERGANGQNFVDHQDPHLDRLLDGARAEPDLEATRPLLVEAQRRLHRDQPYTFLWAPQRLAAAAADLEGVEVTHLSALASLPRWRRRAPRPGEPDRSAAAAGANR